MEIETELQITPQPGLLSLCAGEEQVWVRLCRVGNLGHHSCNLMGTGLGSGGGLMWHVPCATALTFKTQVFVVQAPEWLAGSSAYCIP